MKHTNFIPIDLYSPWKNASQSTVSFQKKNTSWLLCGLMLLLSCMANFAFANDYTESNAFDTETNTSIHEEPATLLNFDRPTSARPLYGSGIACNSQIYVSLSVDCNAGITPDMLLEGVADADLDNFIVNILDGPNAGTDTVTLDDLDNRLRVEVIDTSITPNNKCWGYVIVEDKIAPSLTCKDTTILCNTSTDPIVIGGQPTTSDACSGGVTFTYSDVTENLSCLAGIGATPDTISRIKRTWQGTDASGNSSTCVQTIHVVKPQITMANVIWPADTVLYCGNNPSTEPASTGFPMVNFNGDTVSIDQFCLFGLNFQDQEFTTSCIGTRKILRTWTIYDWCRPNTAPITNAIGAPGRQLIKVSDNVGPVITDLPIVTEIQISFPDLNSCAATLTVPPVMVSDECSPTDSISVKVQVGNSTVNANGGVLTNVPFGPQMVIYTATDDCGNFTQDTVFVTIEDNIAPTVICKENIVVALTQSGTAQVLAQAFDNGTYDNCALDRIRVRRMDSCGVAMDTLPFARFVNFECCDVGRVVMVQLQAWDTLGNTNSCMVRVQVQDKVAPVITCPPNDTVTCEADLTDLSIFGPAVVSGGSCNNISLDLVETRSLNNCGVGTITRTWTVPNTTNSCSQTITVELVPNPTFNVTRIPDSVIYVQCTDGIDIENLGQDSLVVESSGCQLVAINYSQQVFNTSGQCKEVLRRWQVIDWCQNPQANPLDPGYAEYTQIVKLVDTVAPVFTNFLRTMTVNTDHTECSARVTLPTFLATDLCGTTSPNITISGIIANSEGGNDTLTNVTGGTTFLDVPVGTYTVFYTASDGCNNNTTIPVEIIVQDNEGPTVFCDDLVTTLTLKADEPVNSDNRGWVTVWASDFNCKISDCNPDGIVQTLRFPSQGIGSTTPPADTSFGWTFNCATKGEQVGDLWVRDGAGNWDYVRVTVDIQDNMNVCPDISRPSGMVSGTIQNEAGARVEEVTVNVGGYSMTPSVTGTDGNYQFELPVESNYTVSPEKNMEPLNGVSTFDLVLISKHILGLNKLDSPYKHIAADVNRSGTITAYDLVQLRQLILNVKTEFSNNDSWRFVDANYNFITDNPAAESFSEVASIGNLGEDVEAHFIAVKIGDVNVTAVANRGLVSNEARTNGTVAFTAEEYAFDAGSTFSADFNLADIATVEGYQFTMNLDLTKVEIIDIEEGVAKTANFGTTMMNRGIVTTSWNQGADVVQNDERMFSVVLRAKEAGRLSEVVSITSDLTQAEAYNTNGELLDVAIAFNDKGAVDNDFTLYNNKPNPFKEATTISFDLPNAGNAKLTIFDLSGRIVKSINKEFGAGYNEIQVDKSALNGSGIYFYQLETATNTAKKKMILID